jgi:hypothetical protein
VTANDETPFPDAAPKAARAFAATEMIQCPGCSRANPPTRNNCLYCGFALEGSNATGLVPSTPSSPKALQLASSLLKSEPERGSLFHVVVLNPNAATTSLADLAAMSNLTTAELETLLSSSSNGVPLCASEDSAEAELLSRRLLSSGVETIVLADEQLCLESPPGDLRAFEFSEDSLIGVLRRGHEKAKAKYQDITLIVVGRLHSNTVEVEEKRSGGRRRKLSERQLSTDEAVLDIYVQNDNLGCRVRSNNFDFSCLGVQKSITAFQNFAALTEMLRDRAAEADFDHSYNRLRSILTKVWPVEARAALTERRRAGARAFHATITSTDNLDEFTRYSRLRRFLKARESANKV